MADAENQPYLLSAPDSHICAAPLSVSRTAAAEKSWGKASARAPHGSHRLQILREAADWHPDCQADDGSYHENQTWQGEVRLQERPPLNLWTRGRCSQLPLLYVCVCVHVRVCTPACMQNTSVSAYVRALWRWLWLWVVILAHAVKVFLFFLNFFFFSFQSHSPSGPQVFH